jgi:NAD(P)-dependent dehydrogenase (short-subunit alcohol dehydrogenase family)
MKKNSVILVTGASSGFGAATSRLLARRGMTVFGTSRRPAAGSDLPFSMLTLDVRSEESVARCVDAVMAETGRIDALVNNAGYTLTGAAEETSMEEARAQFETNFFGAAAMTRAVLPIMRRQGGGRIINVTSLAGLLGVPFMAIYSASKFALEGWSEGLRQEVRRFGIHVSVIEPGDFKTGNTEATVRVSTPLEAYDPARNRATGIMAKNEQSGPDPSVMADCVARVLQARRPRLRYRVGMDARWVPRLRHLIPEALFEAALRKSYEIDS